MEYGLPVAEYRPWLPGSRFATIYWRAAMT